MFGIRQKLFLTIAALGAAGTFSVAAGQWMVGRVSRELNEAVHRTALRSDVIHTLQTSVWQAETFKRGVFLAMSLDNPSLAARFQAQMEGALNQSQESVEQLKPLLEDPEALQIHRTVEEGHTRYTALIRRFSQVAQQKRFDEIPALVNQIVPLVDRLGELNASLVAMEKKRLAKAAAIADQLQKWSWALGALVVVLLLAAGGAALHLTRKVSELLSRTSNELKASAEVVNGQAQQLTAASQVTAQGAHALAATSSDTAIVADAARRVADETAETADHVTELSSEANQKLDEAQGALQQMMGAMKEIQEASTRITKALKGIDEIALQTNILALNAAVEAARAGEFGSGFAVVAEEVRRLSDRSAEAARDTAIIIRECQTSSDNGQIKLKALAEVIDNAQSAMGGVSNLLDRVREASSEQRENLRQITGALREVEHVTQSNAAASEQTSSSASELEGQAAALEQLVDQLAEFAGESETAPAHAG
jgi:methyl-accepting chemotaxis protein